MRILLLRGLLRLLRGRARFEVKYSAFTTKYDEIVDGNQLAKILRPLSPDEERGFQEAVRQFEHGFQVERTQILIETSQLVRDLRSGLSEEQRAQSVVSFLIDHSGSMKGLRMASALLAVEGAVDALHQSGIKTEILGFTTVGWHGGRSRVAWRRAGQPRNPGRVCDLRHIIYADVDSDPLPWCLRHALRPDLLRENVDGEALAWAAGRLARGKWRHQTICLISDGMPLDDSTVLANDSDILLDHLEATERSLTAQGVTVAFLHLDDHTYGPLHERAAEPQEAGRALTSLLRRALLQHAQALC